MILQNYVGVTDTYAIMIAHFLWDAQALQEHTKHLDRVALRSNIHWWERICSCSVTLRGRLQHNCILFCCHLKSLFSCFCVTLADKTFLPI